MSSGRRIAVLAVVLGACAPASADAVTVGQGASGSRVSLVAGQTLRIRLAPPDSGSTGYHWAVTAKPARRVLRLASNHRSGGRQVFAYKVRGGGITSLKLGYFPPARRSRAKKTFRLTAIANSPAPKPDCLSQTGTFGGGIVARSDTATVFRVRRTVYGKPQGPIRPTSFSFDAFYGCGPSGTAHVLDKSAPARPGDAARNEYANVSLRGSIAAFNLRPACPFSRLLIGCEGFPSRAEAQDVDTGRLLRSADVGSCGAGCDYRAASLVVSKTGGLAFITTGGPAHVVVKSDQPPAPGSTVATDVEYLDFDDAHTVDPDSLYYDGSEIWWRSGGELKHAPLN